MVWDRIKGLFRQTPPSQGASLPTVDWVEADQNPWGVRVLDVRPLTQTMLSASENPLCAANMTSLCGHDGGDFVGTTPSIDRTIACDLRYPLDGPLCDGVLFAPGEMEDKWAIYLRDRRIIAVRSWAREVSLVADLEVGEAEARIVRLCGAITGPDEDPAFTRWAVDALIRTHAIGEVYPVPLPSGDGLDDPGARSQAALWCMSIFGRRAHVAAIEAPPAKPPARPLRCDSLLHIAVARGDAAATAAAIDAGFPLDLFGRDGLTPVHWSLAGDNLQILDLLLARGASVDSRSAEGATPLMNAVQSRSPAKVRHLLDAGAAVDTGDHRGFRAIHRAAEMGAIECLRLLLERGADPNPEVAGESPRSLALSRGEAAIVELLNAAIAG